MQKSAIPVDIHIEKFFNVPVVKDVLAWAHLISKDNYAEISLFRILKQRVGKIGRVNFSKKWIKLQSIKSWRN